MPVFALDTILLGGSQVEPGEEVPSSFVDAFGDEQPVDLDRLVDLGVAEKARKAPTVKGTGAASAVPADPDPEG